MWVTEWCLGITFPSLLKGGCTGNLKDSCSALCGNDAILKNKGSPSEWQ